MQIDWNSAFVPSVSLAEIFLRGTLVYLFLFFLLRILRRQAGAIGISDLLLVVLVADAAQNAMADQYRSLTEGAALIATIAFWDYSLDWIAFRFPAFRRVLRPAPLLLIRNGRIQRKNLRQEMLSEEELMAQLREHGVERAEQVTKCFLEGDGHLSVIKKGGSR